MPDPLTQLLSRFTPVGGVERDELMYQAGRASVPSPARWKALASMLALTQALTLLALVARPGSHAVAPKNHPAVNHPAYSPEWTARRDPTAELVPLRGETNLIDDGPPLRVHTSWTSFEID